MSVGREWRCSTMSMKRAKIMQEDGKRLIEEAKQEVKRMMSSEK